jgi:plastocyanin
MEGFMTGTSAQTRRPPTEAATPKRRLRTLAVGGLVLVALAACGSSGTSGGSASGTSTSAGGAATSSGGAAMSSGGSGAAAAAAVIAIKDFTFTTPASVSPGAKITVHNMDSVAHTVTADSGNAFDDQAGSGNSTFTAPSKPGTYPFHCSIHPEMHGTLVVQ